MFSDLLDPQVAAEALFSVSDLNSHIKAVLSADPILSDVGVTGEISNFKCHSSGHCYFSLKDDRGQIRCCLWRGSASKLSFKPSDGDKVIILGEIDFYVANGQASLIVREMHFAGQGALYESFLRLKTELEAEGLFEVDAKQDLPLLPRKIGVITSETGAVIRDIIQVLGRRYPLATLVLIPAAVQGFSASLDLIRALRFAEALGDLDVLIIGRGGGSAEDLWCFNDEDLARAVFESAIPIVSAVGHESDFTILDFVADRRAPTPSAAAEIVAPDIRELLGYVAGLKMRAAGSVVGEVRLARQKLEFLKSSRALREPAKQLAESRERVAELQTRAREALNCRVKIEGQRVDGLRAQLRALDPKRVLERGYAYISDPQSGAIISALQQVQNGQKLVVTLHGGHFTVAVETIETQKS